MPLRDFRCLSCGHEAERYYVAGADPVLCAVCGALTEMTPNLASGRSKTGVFPFETQIDGRTIRIDDIGGLRRFEQSHGVLLTAFSQEPSNPDSPAELPESRPGGRPYEGLRFQDHCRELRAKGIREATRAIETGRYR